MKTILFIILIILIFTSSCTDNDIKKSELNNIKLIPKYYKTIGYKYNFGVQDSLGQIIEESKFDSLGNLVESIVYQNKDIFRKEINRYDFNNKLFERISFGKDGKLRLKTTFIYSDNGRLLSEVSNPGEDLDFIDKIICKESKITYEYFNDSLLSKKIQIDEGIKKNVEEYLYDDYFRLSKVYEIEGNIKKLRDIYSYYDNNNLKEIESFYDDSRVKWIYSINGDTLRLIRYDKKSKIVFSRIDILDSNGRHLKMNSFNSLGEPTSINKFYYEYY